MNQISDEGLKELISMEGVRYQVYDDRTGKTVESYSQVMGYPTIGVGHLITSKQRSSFAPYLGGGRKLSQYQVMELLKKDVQRFEDPINKKIKKPVTQSMWDAIISLAFNAGANSYAVKNAINAINTEDYEGAAKAILNGPTKSKGKVLSGLVKRRKREALMFLKDGMPGSTLSKVAMGVGVFSVIGLSAFFGTRYVKEHGLPELKMPTLPKLPVMGAANKDEE